ncbi:hypothetical protein [Shinella sp. BYT-45]|uniref:hypothetical protein n=1 Tax=Shinella sp. BYT-45 TaxID=3377377 RepID=UPI00397F2332
MALTYPLDLLSEFPGWATEFEPVYRQEYSRQANGATIGKDFGSPLWRGVWTSRTLSPNDLDYWRARLEALEGVVRSFRAWPMSRCRPIRHPGSSALPAGTLHTISASRNTIRVSGLAGINLSAGDLLQIGAADLHRIMESAAGNPTGLFEVRPHIWPGVATGAAVSISKPSCIMSIVPGSIATAANPATGRGTVSFEGIEVR